MMRVGWVGLGAMGLPMAHCVARAGYRPAAFDIDPSRAASLAADGVKPAASIPEVAAGADDLVLMVATPDQAEVEQARDLPGAVAQLPAGDQTLLVASQRLRIPASPPVHEPKVVAGLRLGGPVPDPGRPSFANRCRQLIRGPRLRDGRPPSPGAGVVVGCAAHGARPAIRAGSPAAPP